MDLLSEPGLTSGIAPGPRLLIISAGHRRHSRVEYHAFQYPMDSPAVELVRWLETWRGWT